MRIFLLPLVFMAAVCPLLAQTWDKLEECRLSPGWRDGDSFHVRHGSEEYIFRLYFVDTPEEQADRRFPERIADQAAYFGMSSEEVLKVGDQAAEFTAKALAEPFTVWTCWQKAPGASSQQRYYGLVEVRGKWLSSMLVEAGLARIYGKRISLPDGKDSRAYRESLQALENQAKDLGRGGWRR